jgi:hypothetical protein
MRLQTVLLVIAGLLAAGLVIAFLAPGAFVRLEGQPDGFSRLAFLLLYLLLISGSVVAAFRAEGSRMLLYALIWALIAGAIGLIYLVAG